MNLETQQRLAEIAEREKKAISGEWSIGVDRGHLVVGNEDIADVAKIIGWKPNVQENAEFIAHARADVPWLLQLVKEQQKEIESHGPEGRNYTNLQYVTLLQDFQSLQAENQRLVEALEEILEVNGDGSTSGGNSSRGFTGGSGHAVCRNIADKALAERSINP